jgi:hypothetical protein
MNEMAAPEVGNWYQRGDTGELLQVVSVDAASIQIQSFDGQLDSVEAEDWGDLELTAAAAPEDWTGPLGEMEADDVTEDDSPSDRIGTTDRN